MRNIFLLLEYDGTAYCGFQRQVDVPTIQVVLEDALSKLLGEAVKAEGCSRTDAGVHATAQGVNFLTPHSFPIDRFCPALNGLLPRDISVWEAREVPLAFRARKCCASKTYTYSVLEGNVRPALLGRFCLHHPSPLDVEAMDKGIKNLLGRHDFVAFSAKGEGKGSSIRQALAARCWREGPLVQVMVKADGFLYRMMRLIVGSLLKVGVGSWEPGRIGLILESKDRREAGPAAPARGLYLREVEYSCEHLSGNFGRKTV